MSIRDAFIISAIACFSTSSDGWTHVSRGELLKYPGGLEKGFHASLVEGYDIEKDCYICKNSWGNVTARPRFLFTKSAAHSCSFVKVYFTLDSIKGKTEKIFNPKIRKCKGILDGKEIDCAWLGPTTAKHTSDYICEYHPEVHGIYKFFGYDIYQYIDIKRPKNKSSKYDDENNKLKKDELMDSIAHFFRSFFE